MKEKIGTKKFKILNIRTGEMRVMKYESCVIEEIMSILFENKYQKKPKTDDKTFIEKCGIIRNKIKTSDKPIEKSLFQMFEKNKKILEDEISRDEDVESDDDVPKKMSVNMFFGAKKK